MSQYDVFKNDNTKTDKQYPYLLEVQSDLFEDSNRAVYIPLVFSETLKNPDEVLNPELYVAGVSTRLFPLDMAAAPRNIVGPKILSIREESDRIVAALDLLFARY